MTNWLLGHHPGRFAAAVSENPVIDFFSFYGESDVGFWIAEHGCGRREAVGGIRAAVRPLTPVPAPSKHGAAAAPAGGR